MGLTPVELENKKFSKARKGYNIEEVDEFFKITLEEFEALYRENQELKDLCKKNENELERYKNMENAIKETLVTAQKAAEDARDNAVKEAGIIIREANLKAEDMLANVRDKIQKQEEEYGKLIKKHQLAVTEFKLFLTTHLEMLEKNGPSVLPKETGHEENKTEEEGAEAPEVYLEV